MSENTAWPYKSQKIPAFPFTSAGPGLSVWLFEDQLMYKSHDPLTT